MLDAVLESFNYVLPALVVGFVAYYLIKELLFQQNEQRKIEALREKKKDSLPIQLQAYERLLLFCERTEPINLLSRVAPIGDNTVNYAQLLTETIKQEFEHNLVQQLYVSDDAWKAVLVSKEVTAKKLFELAESQNSMEKYKSAIMTSLSGPNSPSKTAIDLLKLEVKKIL
ncbi:MAG: hypothetical protein CMB99_14165 [Flavobacteriaceae bacterium]|nr:hypothetical protein [Flavobacteriaceae bacterium]|tara:strand:- start:127199 stop:127711 length:513 start_codon:yes stop_codon:yes gene_type:complete